MMVMDELTEPHRTPSFHHVSAQSPRVGGCVGAFFHLFDWNPGKRLFSTKRLPAERPNQADGVHVRRDRSLKERTNSPGAKLLLIDEENQGGYPVVKGDLSSANSIPTPPSPESTKSDDGNKRVPSVVARLMGLESLPDVGCALSKSNFQDPVRHEVTNPQAGSPPVLLQELLRQECRDSKKSLKEKLPGFAKRPLDFKAERSPLSKRKPTARGRGESLHPYVDSRAPKPIRQNTKRSSSPLNEVKNSPKQPFLARLQTGPPVLLPSKSHNQITSSPLRSPKNTARLLEAAVKILEPNMQPSPRSRYSSQSQRELQRELQCDTQNESGASSLSEKKISSSGYGRGGSFLNSNASKSLKGQSMSRTWNEKDEHREQTGRIVVDSRGSTFSHESSRQETSSRQDQASRRRFEIALAAASHSASPPRTHQSRPANTKSGVLGTHEASIRGFKIDLGSQAKAVSKKNAGSNGGGGIEKLGSECTSLDVEGVPKATLTTVESSVPCNGEPLQDHSYTMEGSVATATGQQSTDVQISATEERCNSVEESGVVAVIGKLPPSGGFRAMSGFRTRSGRQEKETGTQGNRVFPSEKEDASQLDGHPPVTVFLSDAKTPSSGLLSYSRLFIARRQGDKKEGNDKGEGLVLKRTENALMRSIRRRPNAPFSPPPKPSTKFGAETKVVKSSRPHKIAHSEANTVPKSDAAVDQETVAAELRESPKKEGSVLSSSPQCQSKESSVLLHTRARSVDEVFPELPLEETDFGAISPDLRETIQAAEEQFLGFRLQGETVSFDCRSIERMFGKGLTRTNLPSEHPAPGTSPVSPDVFITEYGAPGTFPNSPLVNYEKIFSSRSVDSSLQELLESGSVDWAVESTDQRQRACLTRPHERVCSPSDDEDTVVDTRAVCDTGGTPDRLEIQKLPMDAGWSEDAVTPISVKKSTEKTQATSIQLEKSRATGIEECGQPSPVSVLESPFLDEVPTTPEASLAESEHQLDEELEEGSSGQTKETVEPSKRIAGMLELIETEKIRQAILEISRFRNIDVTSIGFEGPSAPSIHPQEEESYIREVLDASNMLADNVNGHGTHQWFAPDVPMNPSIFDRLEFGSIKLDEEILMESKRWGDLPAQKPQGSHIRSERKLLFDCVNEAILREPWRKTTDSFCLDLPMFPEMCRTSRFRPRLSGEKLVEEVYGTICDWRGIAGDVLDDLIDYDMSVPEGRWVDCSNEVAEVGLDIERMLLKFMIEELVGDLSSISTTRSVTTCQHPFSARGETKAQG